MFLLYLCLQCLFGNTRGYYHFQGYNVALHKQTKQQPGDYCEGIFTKTCFVSSRAVDGNIATCSKTKETRQTQVSWTVEFGRQFYITGIRISNIDIACNWNKHYNLSVNAVIDSHHHRIYFYNQQQTGPYSNQEWNLPLQTNTSLRSLTVEISHFRNKIPTLRLCEVQLFTAYCIAIFKPANGNATIFEDSGFTFGTPYNRKNTAGMIIEFHCNRGYILQGSKYMKCMPSGNYNATVPQCKELECVEPIPREHSRLTTSLNKYSVGSRVSFTCDSGYRLVGNGERYCLENGTWSDRLPTCQAFSCSRPGAINNGIYTIENSTMCSAHNLEQLHYPCNVTINCNEGYLLSHCNIVNQKRSCLAFGGWSPMTCRCEKRKCQSPGVIENGFYQYPNGSNFVKDAAEFETKLTVVCNERYGSQGLSSRTCMSDGTWSGRTPVCKIVTCNHPGMFAHGHYSFENGSYYSAGIVNTETNIHVNCTEGYENTGSDVRMCRSNNLWTGNTPVCKLIECNSPEHFSNGIYIFQNGSRYSLNSSEYGSVIAIKCNDGYVNLGGYGRSCMLNKTWSDKDPICTKINCTHPGYVMNGIYTLNTGSNFTSKETEYGTKIFVKCNVGYKHNGDNYRICSANKTWSGQTPVCSIVTCAHPGREAVVNGLYLKDGDPYMNGEMNYTETIEAVCIKGFIVSSGSKYRRCLANGTWSREGAICTKVTCPITNSTEGIVYKPSAVSEILFSDTINVSCEEGFVFKGSKIRRCLEDGNLDGDMTVCEKVYPEMQSSSQTALIGAATAVGILIFAASFIFAVFIYRRRKSQSKQNHAEIPTRYSGLTERQKEMGQYAEIQETSFARAATGEVALNDNGSGRTETERSDGLYTNTVAQPPEQNYYSFDRASIIPKTAIMVKDLPDLVLTGKAAIEKFRREFKVLPEGLTEKHSQAIKLQNRGKNKYRNLYAYDKTRVVLEKDSKHDSDYINACYIHGFDKVKAYIASQGPLKDTLDDFWRMIWQTKSSKIVMLTNLTEEGKRKCEQYWPDKGSITYGDITVNLKKTEIYSEFVIRNLTMQKGKHAEEKVTHFHFTAWPDKGVPKYASSLVKFRSKVKHAPVHGKGPIVVHCSAGIGRTGTFIAVDYLTDQANALNYIDVAGTVQTLRKQRVNMVQTLEQYIFVHHALLETLMLSSSALPAARFPDAYKDLLITDKKSRKRKIDIEFQMLQKLSPVTEESQYVSANIVRNRQKNRYSDIIPVDEFMPALTSDDGKHTDYVNAVYLPSYKEKKAFIITQTPLETTRKDFWRLVWQHNVHTIVMMNNYEELMDTEIYWTKKGETISFGSIDIVSDGEEELSHHQVLSLTIRRNHMIRYIKQFQFGGWKTNNSLPASPEDMLSLMELVQGWQQQTENHTVLVHCMNGVDKSGLYCVISAVIERMKIEQDVAISHVVEEMRNAREQIIRSVEQYQFCHEAVLAFMQQYETYSNFTA